MCVRSFLGRRASEMADMPIRPIVRSEHSHRIDVEDNDEDI